MLSKPCILSLFPNSFYKFNKHELSCKVLHINYSRLVGSLRCQIGHTCMSETFLVIKHIFFMTDKGV